MITTQNQTPDWSLVENVKERARLGTHIAADAAEDALFVDRDTNALGDAQSALSVRPGAAVIAGTRVTLDSARSVDITSGTAYGEDRRDVVYLALDENDDPVIRVREGEADPFKWDPEIVEQGDDTIANAHRPAPPDMADIVGLVLAIVTVPANTTTLQTRAVEPIRATASVGGVREGDELDNLGSIATPGGRTNRVLHLDPGMDDFGAALGDAVAKANDGDVLIVPPVRFEGPHTPAVIEETRYLSIYSQRRTGRDQWRSAVPKILQNEPMDGPYIRVLTDTSIGDLTFSKGGASDVTDSQPAIAAHKPVRIDGVVGEDLDGPTVDLRNDGTTSVDNVNNSILTNISGKRNTGDVVRATLADGEVENINGLRIHVTTANDCGGHGINLDGGFGNVAKVDHAAHGGGAIRMGGRRSWGRIAYAGDGIGHAVEWADEPNHVDIVHLGGSTTKEVGVGPYPMNRAPRAYPYPGEFDVPDAGQPYRVGGGVSTDGDVTTTSDGDGLVVTTPDGSAQYRIRVDNSGTLTTEQL